MKKSAYCMHGMDGGGVGGLRRGWKVQGEGRRLKALLAFIICGRHPARDGRRARRSWVRLVRETGEGAVLKAG